MTMLYSAEEAKKLIIKNKIMLLAMQLTAAVSLAACILMCSIVNTGNAAKLERCTVITAVVSGWVVIYLYLNHVRWGKTEETHTRFVLEKIPEAEEHCGVFTLDKTPIRVKDGLVLYSGRLEDGANKQRISIYASKVGRLKKLQGKRLRVLTVHGYAAAAEVVE